MQRFTISRHSGAPDGKDHYDLFLEKAGKLKSWRLKDIDFSEPASAEETPDHDLKYLDFEGKLTGGKGAVAVVETGTYLEDSWTPQGIQVALSGRKIRRRLWMAPRPAAKDAPPAWSVEDAGAAARRATTALLREPSPEPPPTEEFESLARALIEEERTVVMLAEQYLKAAPVEWSRAKSDPDLREKISAALARWRHPWLETARRRAKTVDELARSLTPSRAAPSPQPTA